MIFPSWTSDEYYLSGNFAPVFDEMDAVDVPVQGKIPGDLEGIYLRNGSNPEFKPVTYTYPLDGDGMIHALYLREGQVFYRNRWVLTTALQAERRAGKALYGGIMNPVPPDPQWFRKGDEPGPFKNGAFIHVIRHGETYLALNEAAPAYEIDAGLETKGLWRPDGKAALPVNAHTRLDPRTGELYLFTYDVQPPYATVYCLDKDGRMTWRKPVEKSHPTMIHDFLLTENFILIVDAPLVFDFTGLEKGQAPLQWKPELGTKFGLIPRRGDGPARWFPTGPFFAYHYANAYEDGSLIRLDYARHGAMSFGATIPGEHPPFYYRSELDAGTGELKHEQRDERVIEFPRIREDRDSLAHRYFYCPAYAGNPQPGDSFRVLMKYDVSGGRAQARDFGESCQIGEAVFAPKPGRSGEDEGYVMLYAFDKSEGVSRFYLIDSQDFLGEPVAVVTLPRRIPNGLHGSWLPGPW